MELGAYMQYHEKRFRFLEELVRQLKPDPDSAIMDIGPGPFTELLKRRYRNVYTVGFEKSEIFDATQSAHGTNHIVFDLNEVAHRAGWVELPKCDLIVFSEVIEHLFADPSVVLEFLATGLQRDGYLVCTTPNIVAFHKRIRSVLGLNPWTRWESGHTTEYCKADLIRVAQNAGLTLHAHGFANYFGVWGSPAKRALTPVVDVITGIVPAFRRGQYVVVRKIRAS
jgi:trans-aconitate methyltransferase